MTLEGKPIHPQVSIIGWDPVAAEKGEYRHFMQKEIFEQVRSLTDTLAGRVDFEEGRIYLEELTSDCRAGKKDQADLYHRLWDSFTCRHGR